MIYKGYPNGKTDNTQLLKQALAQVAGTDCLVIPEGNYLVSHFAIPSNSHVIIEKGAVLKFSDNFDSFPPVMTRWEGVDCYAMHPLVWIANASNVILEGEGTLDGNGKKWWDYICKWKETRISGAVLDCEKKLAALNIGYEKQPSGGGGRECQFLRPPLLQIYKSRNITIKGLKIINSPFWNVHPVYVQDLVLDGLKIIDPYDSPNTDGIDVESCSNVVVKNCYVDVGDDGIALKSGSGVEAKLTNSPTKNVLIENCVVKNAHGGFTIGSETACGFSDITVKDCIFDGTDRGIRIKTRRGRGGLIRNISASNIKMNGVICPITIMMFYRCGNDNEDTYSLSRQIVTAGTPCIENIFIDNVLATNCRAGAGLIAGLPEMPVRNVTIKNCRLLVSDKVEEGLETEMFKGLKETSYRGFRVAFVDNITFEGNTVNVEPPFFEENLQ